MRFSHLQYFPLAWPFLLVLAALFVLLIALLEIGILEYAYERMGVSRRHVFTLLVLSLLGSYVNIPVAALPAETVRSGELVTFFGVQYVIPIAHEQPGTVIAVNVGGAVIPLLLSIYLMRKNRLYIRAVLGVAIVAYIVHLLARPVPGMGIAVPTFAPPLVAAGVALLLSWRTAAPLAYVAGSLGTLIGADLLNLGRVRGLGAPIASIGGAGTFDGIFLTGILAVLLTCLLPRTTPS